MKVLALIGLWCLASLFFGILFCAWSRDDRLQDQMDTEDTP